MWQPAEDPSDAYDELAETSTRLNHLIDSVDIETTKACTLRQAIELLSKAIEVLETA